MAGDIMRIKICGLTREEDVRSVNALRPDYAGFVIDFPPSRRSLTPEQADALSSCLADDIAAVGVFVDADPDLAARLADEGVIDIIQLHGSEDDDYVRRLQQGPGGRRRTVWKAFQVRSSADVAAARDSSADMIVLDSGQGSGRSFDWTLLRQVGRPFILAGGLDAERIAQVRDLPALAGVDLSSGVETDGCKDEDKIRAAVEAAHEE